MKKQARFDFYEKLYFHELEAREQMTTRLQIPLALLISTIGAMGLMAQNLDRDVTGLWSYGFQASFMIAILFIIVSGGYCIKSAWGYNYDLVPVASEWHDYHGKCIALYASQPRRTREKLISDALELSLRTKYVECAAVNAANNASRSFRYHMTIKFFIFSVAFVTLAFICYFFGGLDKSLHTKPTEISVVSSIPLKGDPLATRPSPPPPPPPPPTRHVRDDRRPPPPPPRTPHG